MISIRWNARSVRRFAVALGAVALVGSAVAPAVVYADDLTPAQLSMAGSLANKILDAIKALPTDSSEGVFEVAILDASSGFDPMIVEAAITQVEGTPGLPEGALRAVRRLHRVYADNSGGHDNGPYGSSPLGFGNPGFVSGGGGGYTGH